MPKLSDEELLRLFKENVYDKASLIDPGDEMDWNDLACGYFLALGASIDQATDYSLLCAANSGKTTVDRRK